MTGVVATPWGGSFGASVGGVDLSGGVGDDVATALRAALAEYRVLVIEGQRLSDGAFAQLGRLWGRPIEFFKTRDRDADHPEVIRISNATATPERLRDGAMHWHQDSTYEAVPAAVTLLSAVEAPQGRNETLFADLTAAFEALPAAQQAQLSPLHVAHDRRGGAPELLFPDERRGTGGTDEPVATVTHPLVMCHPDTGRRALYGISGTAVGIEGMLRDEAIELLVALKQHALAPQFQHSATAAVGTVLIWDNLAVMHRATATEYSDEPGRRRVVRRISTTMRSTDE